MTQLQPRFGQDYDIGWIGFTFHAGDIDSWMIRYGERRELKDQDPVSHAFVVTGASELVEAHLQTGVARAQLSKYLDDPHCSIYFRKPAGWDALIGSRIAAAAAQKIGCGYGSGLIFADALNDTFAGNLLDKLTHGWSTRALAKLCDRQNTFICSELAAYALANQPEYRGKGCLTLPLDVIDPQRLYGDRDLFPA